MASFIIAVVAESLQNFTEPKLNLNGASGPFSWVTHPIIFREKSDCGREPDEWDDSIRIGGQMERLTNGPECEFGYRKHLS